VSEKISKEEESVIFTCP